MLLSDSQSDRILLRRFFIGPFVIGTLLRMILVSTIIEHQGCGIIHGDDCIITEKNLVRYVKVPIVVKTQLLLPCIDHRVAPSG